MNERDFGLTSQELRQLRALRTPHGIQRALDAMRYHLADTAWSPRRVWRERTAHCLEAAIFAAAALRVLGHPPLILDLEGERDSDHVVAVFQRGSCWGAVAKSNFSGLQYREPVYRSVRELVMSYFDQYFNLRGQRTMRAFSRPQNLARFDRLHWMTAEKSVWYIPEHLVEIAHVPVVSTAMARRLHPVNARAKAAGLLGHVRK